MAQDAASIKRYIIATVGDTEDNRLLHNIDFLWDYHTQRGYVYPDLQMLYTKRDAIDLVMGAVRDQTQNGTKHGEQRFATLHTMREGTLSEILRLERRAAANAAPQTGLITTTQPQTPPGTPGQEPWLQPAAVATDTLNPLYRGDPYQPGASDDSGHGIGF